MTQIELREVCRGDLRAVDISSFSQASGSDSGPLFVSSTMSDMFYPPEVFSPNEGSSSEWRADANIIPKLEKRFEISVSGEESESSRKNGYSFCLSENDEIASNSSGFSVTSNGSAWGPSGLEWIDDDFSIPNTPLDSSERCVDLVKKGRVVALPAILQKFQSTYGFKSCKLEEFNTTGNLSSSLFGCRYNLTCKGWGDVYGDYPVRMARGSCSQFNKKLKDKCLFDVKTSTGTMSVIQVYRYSINVK